MRRTRQGRDEAARPRVGGGKRQPAAIAAAVLAPAAAPMAANDRRAQRVCGLYDQIIERVLESMKAHVAEEGLDESVLIQLKRVRAHGKQLWHTTFSPLACSHR